MKKPTKQKIKKRKNRNKDPDVCLQRATSLEEGKYQLRKIIRQNRI